MSIQERFSAQDLEKIKEAVREAESKISGEIVPVFVEKSGQYTIANYRAAIIGAGSFVIREMKYKKAGNIKIPPTIQVKNTCSSEKCE